MSNHTEDYTKYTIDLFKEIQTLSKNKYKIINEDIIYFDTDLVKLTYLRYNECHNIVLCSYSTTIDNEIQTSTCLKKIIFYNSYPLVKCLWFRNIQNIKDIKKFILTETILT